jgi:hypothetical protein
VTSGRSEFWSVWIRFLSLLMGMAGFASQAESCRFKWGVTAVLLVYGQVQDNARVTYGTFQRLLWPEKFFKGTLITLNIIMVIDIKEKNNHVKNSEKWPRQLDFRRENMCRYVWDQKKCKLLNFFFKLKFLWKYFV